METLVYAICFCVGLLFTLLSAFFGHAFGGTDGHAEVGTGGHAEAGFDHSGMPGVSPFSPTIISSFITAFGGFGLIFTRIQATSNVLISMPLSIVAGLAIAGLIFWVLNSVFKNTQSSSESRLGSLVGRTATVITPIPASGVGEIAYLQAGTRYTAPAREQNGAAVANGQTVKIIRVAESQFFVSIV